MKILAIDTSGQTAGAAVVDDRLTIGELTVHTQGLMTHSEILLGMIDSLFQLTRLTIEDMDYIACVSGPGSFTGLRIGAATAQGLARGACKALLAVPTLDALAYNIGYAAAPGTLVVPMMDARRTQVYTAFYQPDDKGSLRRTTDYMALSVPEMLAQVRTKLTQITAKTPGQVIFLGDGVSAYEDMVKTAGFAPIFAPSNNNRQRAASAGTCAFEMINNKNALPNTLPNTLPNALQNTLPNTLPNALQNKQPNHESYEPAPFALLYVRKPQAERARLGEQT